MLSCILSVIALQHDLEQEKSKNYKLTEQIEEKTRQYQKLMVS
jgi:cell division protein ZapA (FtsZ GTPase activity inhibitor)